MFQKELQEIGMSKNESKIYETILELGTCGVSEISKKSEIHRRSVYDALQRLIERGVVFQIFGGKENTYSAADPQKLLEMIREKEETFERILPYLEQIQKSTPRKEATFIYK